MSARAPALSIGFLAVWIVGTAPALAALPAPVLSQFRLVAVAPFTDEVGMRQDVVRYAAGRLAELLAGAGVKVVPPASVEQSLRQLSLRPSDLVSPTAAGNVARLVSADAIITGRLIRADVDSEASALGVPAGPSEAFVNFELRVMIVDERRLFYDEVSGSAVGRITGLIRATDFALWEFLRHVTAGSQATFHLRLRKAAGQHALQGVVLSCHNLGTA